MWIWRDGSLGRERGARGARGGLPFARSFVGDEALTVGRTDAGGVPYFTPRRSKKSRQASV